jgi:hypothetical protein
MFKDKLVLHQLVLFGVMGCLVLVGLITGSFVFGINLLWWMLGSVIGFLFVFLDRFVNSFVTNSNGALGLRLKELVGQNKFKEGLLILLNERHEQKELVMRSFLFLLVWVVMSFFTITSVNSQFARGLMLGIGTHLVFDFVYDYFWNKERFDNWFWQIKRTFSDDEKKWTVIGFSIIYLFLIIRF